MPDVSICLAALPGAWPALENASEDVARRRVSLSGLDDGAAAREAEASVLAARVLPRLARAGGSHAAAESAVSQAGTLIVLLPAGRYDDGVWTPIIERLLDAAAGRRTVLAWTGLEPFLAPFGRRVEDIWSDPRLAPGVLGVLARHARSLAAVLKEREAAFADGMLRQGLARLEPAEAGAGTRITLVLA